MTNVNTAKHSGYYNSSGNFKQSLIYKDTT